MEAACANSLQLCFCRPDGSEFEIGWRAHLHPPARSGAGVVLAIRQTKAACQRLQMTIRGRRPRLTIASSRRTKLAVAKERGLSGATVSGAARKYGVVTGLLFRWREKFGVAQSIRAKLSPSLLPPDMVAACVPRDLTQPPEGMMAVDLPDGRHAFAAAGNAAQLVNR